MQARLNATKERRNAFLQDGCRRPMGDNGARLGGADVPGRAGPFLGGQTLPIFRIPEPVGAVSYPPKGNPS
eukprot:8319281-Pyramimonas_sp.AAC.1